MSKLDAATVLLQWAVGGLFFLWVTTRGRVVGIGYGWLLRTVYGTFAALAVVVAVAATGVVWLREVSAIAVVAATLAALVSSVVRRKAGVSGQRAEAERKRQRVAAMAGAPSGLVEPELDNADAATAITMRDAFGRVRPETTRKHGQGREFAPTLDLVAPIVGVIGLVAAGWSAGGNHALVIARTLVGAALMGAVTDAMLLGHWYLVQPGLPRQPIHDLNDWLFRIWPVEVALFLLPTGMISAINGTIHDGSNGLLAWFWVACALGTGVLSRVTKAALKERAYSAVMAATGLLYLAILTAFGTDLVARAILR